MSAKKSEEIVEISLLINEDLRIDEASSTGGDVLGHSPAGLLGQDIDQLFVLDDDTRQRFVDCLAKKPKKGPRFFVLGREKGGPGRRLLADLRPAGGALELLAVVVDEGARRQHLTPSVPHSAQTKARKLTSLLALTVEECPEGILLTDPSGKIEYVNPAYLKLTGYRAEELLGASVAVLRSGHHGDDFYRVMWDTIERGRSWEGRFLNLRKDGTLFEEEATVFPLYGAQGRITHFAAIKRLSARRYLVDEQIGQAQKLEAVAQLATGVAHDFNNQLTVILTSLQYLMETIGDDHPGKAAADEIHDAGLLAAELTGHLLAFTRQQLMKPRPMNTNTMLARIEDDLGGQLPSSVEASFSCSGGPGEAKVDLDQLMVALSALAKNAMEAMPDGGPLGVSIEIVDSASAKSFEAVGVSPPLVCISMQDSGDGMDRATRQRAIEPFFTTKGAGHQGLGLSIAWGIVRQCGGNLRVDSRLGSGTKVSIFFPLV